VSPSRRGRGVCFPLHAYLHGSSVLAEIGAFGGYEEGVEVLPNKTSRGEAGVEGG